jgi:hypothetical protein
MSLVPKESRVRAKSEAGKGSKLGCNSSTCWAKPLEGNQKSPVIRQLKKMSRTLYMRFSIDHSPRKET